MTALTRFVPLDNLSLLEGSKLATISVYDDRIYLHLQDDDGADGRSFTFEQFYQALHGLLKPEVAPTPSSDDKSPTAATVESNSGTLKVGGEVRWKHSGAVGTLEVVTRARSVAVRHGDGSIKTGHMNELEAKP